MSTEQPNNPLHGITLETLLKALIRRYGWKELARRVSIPCFVNQPTLNSSLKFLRKNQWAREMVEELFLERG